MLLPQAGDVRDVVGLIRIRLRSSSRNAATTSTATSGASRLRLSATRWRRSTDGAPGDPRLRGHRGLYPGDLVRGDGRTGAGPAHHHAEVGAALHDRPPPPPPRLRPRAAGSPIDDVVTAARPGATTAPVISVSSRRRRRPASPAPRTRCACLCPAGLPDLPRWKRSRGASLADLRRSSCAARRWSTWCRLPKRCGYLARPGGSPANVAVGLGRLGLDRRPADPALHRLLRTVDPGPSRPVRSRPVAHDGDHGPHDRRHGVVVARRRRRLHFGIEGGADDGWRAASSRRPARRARCT